MIFGVIPGLVAVLILLIAHGFFVAGEFAIVAVDRNQIERRAADGDKRAAGVLKALKTLSFQLSGAQLGITITSLLVGFLIQPVLAPALESLLKVVGATAGTSSAVAVVLGLVLATGAEMVFAELVPQNLAIARPTRIAEAVSTPMRAVNTLFKPLILFLNAAANRTVKLLGIEPRDELTSVHSLEELEVLIRSSRKTGALREEEYSLLVKSISFGDKTAVDALTPRVSVTTISKDASLAELAKAARDSGHSRLPAIGTDIDDIVGIAYVKDIYSVPVRRRTATKVAEILKSPLVVPESRPLGSLLAEMRADRKQMAVVVDEYGGTAGIISLEDLLEEIVGEIEDEYDEAEPEPEPGVRGAYTLSGMAHLDDVREEAGLVIPAGPYETLAGFLLHLFDRIPEAGDHISFQGWELKVVTMDARRIDRVLLVAPPPPGTGESET